MDEATANIDTKTDGQIQKLIHTEFLNSTVLTIAHRLDTIINYDKIIVLDKGKVVEQGVPGDLLMMDKDKGEFRSIVEENGESYRAEMLKKAKFTEQSRRAYEKELQLQGNPTQRSHTTRQNMLQGDKDEPGFTEI